MRAGLIVELHPVADTGACLRSGVPSVQRDALVFQGAPQAFDEDII